MSEDTGVSLLDPSIGLADDVDVTIKSIRAALGKDTNDPSKQWPNLTATWVLPNGAESHDFYSAGDLAKLRPSPDGLRLLPNAEGAKLSDQSNAWKLISSIINALRGMEGGAGEAFLKTVAGSPDRLDHFDGMQVHLNRVSKKQAAEGKDKPGTLALVTRIVALPGAKAKSVGKGATKAAAATTAAKPATTAPAASAPAAGAVDDETIAGLLIEAVRAKGSIARNKIATEVFALAKAKGIDWKAVMTRANQESFLTAAAAEPHLVEGEDTPVVLSYDGKAVSLAE